MLGELYPGKLLLAIALCSAIKTDIIHDKVDLMVGVKVLYYAVIRDE
jgi:hypothetical protein